MTGGMVIACAECGCRVQSGVRIEVCADPDCCCADLPVRPEMSTADPPAESSPDD